MARMNLKRTGPDGLPVHPIARVIVRVPAREQGDRPYDRRYTLRSDGAVLTAHRDPFASDAYWRRWSGDLIVGTVVNMDTFDLHRWASKRHPGLVIDSAPAR